MILKYSISFERQSVQLFSIEVLLLCTLHCQAISARINSTNVGHLPYQELLGTAGEIKMARILAGPKDWNYLVRRDEGVKKYLANYSSQLKSFLEQDGLQIILNLVGQ